MALNTEIVFTPSADVVETTVDHVSTTISSATSFVLGTVFNVGVTDYNQLSNLPTIPDQLSDLADDATHRVVTDIEKSGWNSKEPAITKKSAFNKDFGNTPGTVCDGSDTRLSNSRSPTSHSISHVVGGSDSIWPVGSLRVNTSEPDTTNVLGSMYWNQEQKTVSLRTSSETTQEIGQELPVPMHNNSGVTIPNGTPVKIFSGNGYPIISKALGSDLDQDCVVGITTQDIAHDAVGFVTCFGIVHDLNMSAYTAGDTLYLAPTGGITNVMPRYPNSVVHLGHCVSNNSVTGSIFVNVIPETFQKFFDVMPFAGIVTPGDVTLSYDPVNRLMVVSPTTIYWAYFYEGREYRITASLSAVHGNTTGLHFFYLDSSGSIATSMVPWDLCCNIPLMVCYFNTTTGQGIAFNERHKVGDKLWHKGQHDTIGSYFGSGLAATGYTLLTATNADVQFGIDAGVINDEDIANHIAGQVDGGTYNILYRIGVNGDWVIENSTMPYPYNGTNFVQWNQYIGGTWQLTDGANGEYVNLYVVAIPALDVTKTIVCVPSQKVYTSLATATGSSIGQDITWGAMPFVEFSVIHRFTMRIGTGYASTGRGRIEAYSDMRGTTTSVTVSGTGSATHNSLAGLNAGDYVHLTAAEYAALSTPLKYSSEIRGIRTVTGTSDILVQGDAGGLVVMTDAAANTVTVNSGVFTTNQVVTIRQSGAGVTTVVAGSGVTIAGKSLVLNGQHSVVQLVAVSSTSFYIFGDVSV